MLDIECTTTRTYKKESSTVEFRVMTMEIPTVSTVEFLRCLMAL